MSSTHEISRRQFLISTAAVGGALVLGFYIPSRTAQAANIAPQTLDPARGRGPGSQCLAHHWQ